MGVERGLEEGGLGVEIGLQFGDFPDLSLKLKASSPIEKEEEWTVVGRKRSYKAKEKVVERQQGEKVVKAAKEIVKVKEVNLFVQPKVNVEIEREQAEKVAKKVKESITGICKKQFPVLSGVGKRQKVKMPRVKGNGLKEVKRMEGNKLQVEREKDMEFTDVKESIQVDNLNVMEVSKNVIRCESKRRREEKEISQNRVKIEDFRMPQLDGLDDSDSDMEVDNEERGRRAVKPRAFECNICSNTFTTKFSLG